MLYKDGRVKVLGCMLLLLFLVVACDATDTTSNASSNSSNKIVTVTTYQGTPSDKAAPVSVNPKPVHGVSQGSSGGGPVVITSSTHTTGGNTTGEQVVLKDRILVISSTSKQNAANGSSSLVTLALIVKNTSTKPIMNQPTFFQLMGTEGDTFSYQSNSSDNFYGAVPASSSHSGTIVFQLPSAAAHNLRLLYRPEVATETALVMLHI